MNKKTLCPILAIVLTCFTAIALTGCQKKPDARTPVGFTPAIDQLLPAEMRDANHPYFLAGAKAYPLPEALLAEGDRTAEVTIPYEEALSVILPDRAGGSWFLKSAESLSLAPIAYALPAGESDLLWVSEFRLHLPKDAKSLVFYREHADGQTTLTLTLDRDQAPAPMPKSSEDAAYFSPKYLPGELLPMETRDGQMILGESRDVNVNGKAYALDPAAAKDGTVTIEIPASSAYVVTLPGHFPTATWVRITEEGEKPADRGYVFPPFAPPAENARLLGGWPEHVEFRIPGEGVQTLTFERIDRFETDIRRIVLSIQ